MLTLVVVILHNLDLLPELLKAWKQAGVPGVTLLPSLGGYHAVSQLQRGGLASLLNIVDQANPQQRMLLSLVDNENTLAIAISEAERVVGGFDRPHSGILFTVEVGKALGLKKWGDTQRLEKAAHEKAKDSKPVDKGTENLLGWFEEEVRDLHGTKTLTGWRKKRKLQLSVVFKEYLLEPTVVSVDTPLNEVMHAFLKNPKVTVACVINREDRLVGLIHENWFAEMMLVPAMPENFIQDPDQYEKAIAYARMDPDQKAFDIMEDSVYVMQEGTLEEAFIALQKHSETGLPVVNKHYRVVGFLSLSELMAVYFAEEDK
ncbi:MAG TPA: CBS domain-containing protein [Anaerolineales bacterium]|nr:CBS domain-containing protein [Anaerolineales bacterium]